APHSPNIHIDLAQVQAKRGALEDAKAAAAKALPVTPDNLMSFAAYGKALEARGLLDEALTVYREIYRLKPNGHFTLSTLDLLVSALAKRGLKSEIDAVYISAITTAREAIQNDSLNAAAHNRLGYHLGRMGATADGLVSYREALRLRPDNPQF